MDARAGRPHHRLRGTALLAGGRRRARLLGAASMSAAAGAVRPVLRADHLEGHPRPAGRRRPREAHGVAPTRQERDVRDQRGRRRRRHGHNRAGGRRPTGRRRARAAGTAIVWMLLRLRRTEDPAVEQVAIGTAARAGNALLITIIAWLLLSAQGAHHGPGLDVRARPDRSPPWGSSRSRCTPTSARSPTRRRRQPAVARGSCGVPDVLAEVRQRVRGRVGGRPGLRDPRVHSACPRGGIP